MTPELATMILGPGQPKEPTPDEIKKTVGELLAAMEAEGIAGYGPGLRCPKCGGQLAHYRLHGYRCVSGCQ